MLSQTRQHRSIQVELEGISRKRPSHVANTSSTQEANKKRRTDRHTWNELIRQLTNSSIEIGQQCDILITTEELKLSLGEPGIQQQRSLITLYIALSLIPTELN